MAIFALGTIAHPPTSLLYLGQLYTCIAHLCYTTHMKKVSVKKLLLPVLLGIVAICIALFGYGYYVNNSSAVSFVTYEAKTLPRNLAITDRKIYIYQGLGTTFKPNKQLVQDTKDGTFTILQNGFNGNAVSCDSFGSTPCISKTTPKGIAYTVVQTTNYDEVTKKYSLDSQHIFSRIGNTDFNIYDDTKNATPYTDEEINALIDSFTPIKYSPKLPVKKLDPTI